MPKMPIVIPGEASESESEEEINSPTIGLTTTTSQVKLRSPSTLQGIIIAGEAPESDEEQDANSATSMSPLTSDNKPVVQKKINKPKHELQYKSLLHKKLRERNVLLRKDITELVHQTVTSAGRDLNTINQQLLRSQVQLQEAATALRTLQNNANQLNNKLAAVTSASFLPQINISD